MSKARGIAFYKRLSASHENESELVEDFLVALRVLAPTEVDFASNGDFPLPNLYDKYDHLPSCDMGTLWTSAILMSVLVASAAAAPRTEMASASLFDGHEVAAIVCDTRQNVPLSTAAGLLAGDLAKLTGRR